MSTEPGQGHYIDRQLQNDLIVDESIILVTMDSLIPLNGRSFSAQVFEVASGSVMVRIFVMGTPGGCSPPSTGISAQLKVNYLIINPSPGP